MHRWILGVGLAAAALSVTAASTFAHAADASCPAAGAEVLERFTSADCADCWSRAGQALASERGALLDWIVPTPAGQDAPLSTAAPAEARERALRLGGALPEGQQVRLQRHALAGRPMLHVGVQSGPAWNGYIGVRIELRGRAPKGATAWMALVERLPAGAEGSEVARELVRSVAGPLPLHSLRAGRAVTHLGALRWPDSARPERLQARGWIEAADGRLLALAYEGCAAQRPTN